MSRSEQGQPVTHDGVTIRSVTTPAGYIRAGEKLMQQLSEEQIYDEGLEDFRGDHIGWGPWRRDWFSFCPRHDDAVDGCKSCKRGRYVSPWTRLANRLKFQWQWWRATRKGGGR